MKQKKNLFLILLLAITVFVFFNFTDSSDENKDFSERVKVALREVGNQLLLSNGDSISLVLPVKEHDKNEFEISFENQLKFMPNDLVLIVKKVFKKTTFSKNYRVSVISSFDSEVAYSYEINADKEKTIIPCSGRNLPKNRYTIKVTFLEIKSSNFLWIFYIFIPIIFGVFYKRFFKVEKQKMVIEKVDNNCTVLGSFIFYPAQNKLVKKASEINLSKKECELLAIFVANPNQVIKREELTKKVWEDNGVFVGRSLDTYISKLRKKLQEDKNIKLTNVHGVGYKLEIK
ncbi:Transcriptional regulatory protein, C terminal [Polaribacter sp. KT25b]|uniref:winged helix-turn-helix domain-containing protein n=1 Tax=Polaribacter sp. KT25b TaxID=1855336 RepID=UPI00087A4E43|nr:winged helix-turn-helix domain-containing protein [Polaribacter sp. KT25b]SDS54605.1 Transcriptional regulatory protein, C terminal [Polaribacter sp. KT25b]